MDAGMQTAGKERRLPPVLSRHFCKLCPVAEHELVSKLQWRSALRLHQVVQQDVTPAGSKHNCADLGGSFCRCCTCWRPMSRTTTLCCW